MRSHPARRPGAQQRPARPTSGMTVHGPGAPPRAGRCRQCANPITWHSCGNQRLIALHPTELPTPHVPTHCRWHLSSGIAHPHSGGQAWCRIPHVVLCPASTPTTDASRPLQDLRRQLAVRSRRLVDATSCTTPSASEAAPPPGEVRPVVQLLHGRYLGDAALAHIRCVARIGHGHQRCVHCVLSSRAPAGDWTLAPLRHQRGAADPPARVLAVYDLTRVPADEQQRWRAQLCPEHADVRADLNRSGWQVFNPLRHAAHIRSRLPHADSHPSA
ncbi:DUF6083 domain-containing protein [Streptomyces sp. NPDC059897]|uniref:DUF6083 domain-containing protein n=1 Tax=Streptomyces sp. NPDC059897 TaxID=3346994 RepID=UPI003659925C